MRSELLGQEGQLSWFLFLQYRFRKREVEKIGNPPPSKKRLFRSLK